MAKHWIQGAIKHPGRCTPLSKPGCTGHARALAKLFKKKHGFHKKQLGGAVDPNLDPEQGQAAPQPAPQGPQKVPMNAVRPPRRGKAGRLPKRMVGKKKMI